MVRREIAHGNGGRSHRLRKHCRWRFLAFFESRCFLKVRPLVAGGVFMRWVLDSSPKKASLPSGPGNLGNVKLSENSRGSRIPLNWLLMNLLGHAPYRTALPGGLVRECSKGPLQHMSSRVN